MELGDRFLSLFVGRHLDERESARTAGRRITHDANRFDVAGAAEQLLEL
jgi:hypothetical protein